MTETNQFIEFLMQEDVLKFGEFTLKSGRISPYFFNLGEVSSGAGFNRLGQAYADCILAHNLEFDVLFGPAYKGIPIAVATAVALAERGMNVGVAYNRKEAKDHGEGGQLVGAQVKGRVLLIDDVLTSGKAIREAVDIIRTTSADIVGAMIAMDRQELNDDGVTAVGGLSQELGAPVMSIANLTDLISYLSTSNTLDTEAWLAGVQDYQRTYCAL